MQLLPGMTDTGTEFFTDQNGKIRAITNGQIINFENISPYLYRKVNEVMHADRQALQILKQWFPHSETEQLKKFVSCRFGGLDYRADFDKDNAPQCGEYVECHLRGNCIGEGIVCKSVQANGKELNLQEIQLLRLISTPKTNESISDMLGIPLGTFHKIKKNLYRKLAIQTKQEALSFAYRLGLL